MATCTENSQHQQRLMELVYDEEKIVSMQNPIYYNLLTITF